MQLHPLLAGRWSPTGFDPARDLTDREIELMLEAARWAPSAGNSQPWSFLVGRRGDDVHRRLVSGLRPSAARWAPSASVLLANLCHRYVEGTDWDYSDFGLYDLGQAVAHLTLQARALGLFVRQFRAFDRDRLSQEFDVPPHWEITTMAAVGAVGQEDHAEPAGPGGRQRRSLAELRWPPSG